eukprot:1033999-Rhodomonas_salina.4
MPQVSGPRTLLECYALPGTEMVHATTGLHVCCAMSGTEIAYGAASGVVSLLSLSSMGTIPPALPKSNTKAHIRVDFAALQGSRCCVMRGSGIEIAPEPYTRAMRCPVLNRRMVLPGNPSRKADGSPGPR